MILYTGSRRNVDAGSAGQNPGGLPETAPLHEPHRAGQLRPASTPQLRMIDKIKPFLITALVAIVAVGLFNRFAPASVKKLIGG
jgi:hypothetical protein